jgi:hypothetical protein
VKKRSEGDWFLTLCCVSRFFSAPASFFCPRTFTIIAFIVTHTNHSVALNLKEVIHILLEKNPQKQLYSSLLAAEETT